MAQKFKAYRLTLSTIAEAAYIKIAKEAVGPLERGEVGHAAVKRLRIVDECLDTIIPHSPFATDRALVGNLSNIFRVKKGRTRICYIASSAEFEIIVLYISETPRKEGDRHDPYAIFSSLVMSGKFDGIFDALGVRRPKTLSAGSVSFQ